MKTFKEFRNLLESHLEETYDIYHDHYNAAVNHAAEHVHKKTGLHVHDRDLMNIPRKPVPGQTNSLRFQLHKDGKPTNKYAHVQVYHHDSKKEKPFELNTYHDTGKHKIEEDIYHMDEEQINELKKSTLQSYADTVGGSSRSRGGNSGQLGVLAKKANTEVKSGNTAAAQTTAQKFMKRQKGLKTAVDKLHQRRFEEEVELMDEGNAENKAKKREFDKTLAKNVAARRGYMQRAVDNKQDGFKNEVQAGRAVRKMVRSSSMAKIAKGQEWIDRMKEGVEHMDGGQIDERNIENRNKKDAAARKLSANGYDVAAGRAIQKGSKFITKTRDSLATTNKMKTARAEKDRKVFVKAVRDRKNKAPEQGASSWYKQGRYSGD